MNASGVLIVVIGCVAALTLAILKKLIVDEASGWLMPLSKRLISIAATRLPHHTERYEEEWLAELAGFGERRLSGFRFAVGILRGAKSMGTALEETAISSEPSLGSEIATATQKAAPDLERIASLIRRLVENSRGPGSAWSELMADLRSTISQSDVADDLEQIDEAFADHIEAMKQCEPYDLWRAHRDIRERRASRANPTRSAPRESRQWSGLSGPDWWRRR